MPAAHVFPDDLPGQELTAGSSPGPGTSKCYRMRIADSVREATFVSRENRFTCLVELPDGKEVVYLPNSGRLDSVLLPGRMVLLAEKASSNRRTRYDLVAASLRDRTLVSVDSRVPGELVHQALSQRALEQFAEYTSIRREVPRGRSRLDFLLSGPKSQCFLEVKSVTLVKMGRGLFPDAPTLRGRRHLESLTWAKREGYEAAIIFVIQREDAEGFSPNDAVDSEFGSALREARLRGVDIYAYRCRVSRDEVELADRVAIYL